MLGETGDDRAAGNDAAETVSVVHDGNKVLLQNRLDDEGGFCEHVERWAELGTHDVPNTATLMVAQIGAFGFQNLLQKIAFGHTAEIMTVLVENGDGGVAVVAEQLQSLAHGIIGLQTNGASLGDHHFCNIHGESKILSVVAVAVSV